jgi:hypothetical protein
MDIYEKSLYRKEKNRIYNREKARLKRGGHWTAYNKEKISTKNITDEAVKVIIDQKNLIGGNGKKILFDFEREIIKTNSDISRVSNKFITKLELSEYKHDENAKKIKENLKKNVQSKNKKSSGYAEIKSSREKLKREMIKAGIYNEETKKILDTKLIRSTVKENLEFLDGSKEYTKSDIDKLVSKTFNRQTNRYRDIKEDGIKLGIKENAVWLFFNLAQSDKSINYKGFSYKYLTKDDRHYILRGGFLNEVILDEKGKIIASKGKGIDYK